LTVLLQPLKFSLIVMEVQNFSVTATFSLPNFPPLHNSRNAINCESFQFPAKRCNPFPPCGFSTHEKLFHAHYFSTRTLLLRRLGMKYSFYGDGTFVTKDYSLFLPPAVSCRPFQRALSPQAQGIISLLFFDHRTDLGLLPSRRILVLAAFKRMRICPLPSGRYESAFFRAGTISFTLLAPLLSITLLSDLKRHGTLSGFPGR